MKKIGNLVGIFALIFAIFSWIGRESDFVGVADVIDDTLVDIGGENFINSSMGSDNLPDVSKESISKNGRIFIEKNFEKNNLLKISVYAKDVFSPVIGVSFHFKYDKEKLSFVKYEAGDFLENGGKPFYLVKDAPQKNIIYFGETLKKGDMFPTQGGKIVDFYFKISDYAMMAGSKITTDESQYSDNPPISKTSKTLFYFLNGNISTIDKGVEKIKNVKFENSEVDLLEKNTLSKGIASVFENFDFLKNIFFLGIVILSLFFAFKHGKKRAESSVNFK